MRIIASMKNTATTTFYQKLCPWINWLLATGFVLFQFFLQSTAGVMTREWMHDFHISHLGVSNLSAAFFYMYVLMQVPAGVLFDKYGPRIVLALASLLLGAGCFMLSFVSHYGAAFFARMLMGAGAAFGFVGMLLVSAMWFKPQHFALMVGLAETLGMLASSAGENVMAWVVQHLGWRISMSASGVIALVLFVLCVAFVRRNPDYKTVALGEDALSIGAQITRALRSRVIWLAGGFGFFMFAIINAFTSLWGVPFLQVTHHLSLSHAALVTSMVFIGVALGAPLSGWVCMRMNKRKPVMFTGAFIAFVLMSLVVFLPGLSPTMLCILLFLSGAFCAVYIQCFALAKDQIPAGIHGAGLALTNMIFMLSAPILQTLIALLLHTSSFRVAMSILPAGFFVAFLLVCFMSETTEEQG
jgi:MFS family permease